MGKINRLNSIKAKYNSDTQDKIQTDSHAKIADDEMSPLAELVSQLDAKYDTDKIYYGNPDEFKLYPNEKIRLKPHTGDKKELLRESIKQDGVLDPALVWIKGNDKIILAGQNRNIICREENMQLPYIVKEIHDEKQADNTISTTRITSSMTPEVSKKNHSFVEKLCITGYLFSDTRIDYNSDSGILQGISKK